VAAAAAAAAAAVVVVVVVVVLLPSLPLPPLVSFFCLKDDFLSNRYSG
jgi:hypothetical protein